MDMSDGSASTVEALFKSYRSNFEILESLLSKKGIGLDEVSRQIKVKGETFGPTDLFEGPWDWTLHTCNEEPHPLGLMYSSYFQNHWTYDVKLSSEQTKLLNEEFEKLVFDLDKFQNAVNLVKGFWPDYLQDSETVNAEGLEVSSQQQGDVLSRITSNYNSVVATLFESKQFKKIESFSPLERRGIIADKLFEKFAYKYYKCQHFAQVQCCICKQEFLPQINREWIGKIPPLFCGKCVAMAFSASTDFYKRLGFSAEERKTNFIKGVIEYSEYFGFIPPVGYQKRKVIRQLNKVGIPQEELMYAMKVSSLLPWTGTVKEMFGSWAHFLEEAGLLSQRQRGRGGHQSIASDGHLCLSMGERAICEFLSKNSISHEREPMYPTDEKLNPNGLLRGDFLIGELIIEFAGMMSNQDYAERMKIKEKLAKSRKIPWLKLETSKLDDLNEMLSLIKSKVPNLDI